MRSVPSLRGLQAFGAVARSGNLAQAAESLGITPSAVSHRIRGLEEELGIPLLRRSAKGLALTEAGRRYRVGVEDAFGLLARATAELRGPDLSRPLTVSLTSEIGIHWLMPRFHRFRALHPDIDIAILSTYDLANLVGGEADLALRYGEGGWPGLKAEPFLRFAVSPLCAPRVRDEIRGLAPDDALAKATLILSTDDDWHTWLEAAVAAGVKPARQLRFANYSMAVAAAVNGQGIVLGYSGYVDKDVAAGTLVQPFDLTVPVSRAYYLVYLESRLTDERVRAFRDWVMSESESARAQQA
jgi:LysR family glycine cleavage system transcriptional activator